jgi:hypothetical protein
MSTPFRAGLLVLAVLSLADLAAPLMTDGESPPMEIALIGSALGAISLVLAALAWRGRTGAALGLVGVRAFSALTAVPAFFVSGVPVVPMVLAGTAITLTVIGSVLVLTGVRRPALVGAR